MLDSLCIGSWAWNRKSDQCVGLLLSIFVFTSFTLKLLFTL